MKARSALGGLALVLGMTLPAAAQTPDAVAPGAGGVQLAQAPAPGTGPGMGEHRPGGHGGWRHHKMHRMHHRVSLAGLALRHRQALGLTPAQVDSLRKLATDSERDAIKRQADRRLAELDLRTLMMPDPADPNKARDMSKVEAKVREIEKLRADGRVAKIRAMEQSRQVLTPEQREKLHTVLAERWQHRRGGHPGMRGMTPEDGGRRPAATGQPDGSAG